MTKCAKYHYERHCYIIITIIFLQFWVEDQLWSGPLTVIKNALHLCCHFHEKKKALTLTDIIVTITGHSHETEIPLKHHLLNKNELPSSTMYLSYLCSFCIKAP